MTQLHIATVATDKRFYYPYLVESCRRNGVPLTVLGMGETWQGYTWKYTKMIEFLGSVPPDDLVCFVDAYDVVCVRNLSELVPMYEELEASKGCRIIVGHDETHLVGELAGQIFFGSCHGNRLNAGSYMGRAQNLLHILQESTARDPGHHDDQILLTELCRLRQNDFYIDTDKEIFFVYASSLNEIRVPPSTRPFFVHGNACTFLNNLLETHGYDEIHHDKKRLNKEIFYFVIEKILHHLWIFMTMYWWLLLLLFLALYFLAAKKTRSTTFRRLLTGGWVIVSLPFLFFLGYVLVSDFVWR